ncbi:nucleolar protein 12-domain-containing protein [Hypoxylon fuscum]|nr:nucleolar protein 12-domain-containing protein [Hypoxylon fuscum]
MFARPRPKKGLLPPPRKRKAQHSIEELKFDDDSRADYLTGFHKRKLQRIKNAQEQAAQRARQEKIEMRKQIRDDRKKEVEDHVQAVNAILKEAQEAGYVGGEATSEDENGEWGGFEDPPELEPVDHEEEYIDEERYTTVTIESVNVSKDGLSSSRPEEEDSSEENEETAAKDASKPPPGSKEKTRPPKKKQKFRYETKSERQQTRRKQKVAKDKRKPRD